MRNAARHSPLRITPRVGMPNAKCAMRWKTACHEGDAETFVSRGGWRVKPFVRTVWSNAASLCMCVLWDEHVQTEHGFDAMHGLSVGKDLNGSQDF